VPALTIIAGPNGAGKSTLTRLMDFEGRDRLLDPDAIARALNRLDPAAAALSAGRETLKRTAEYLDQGVSFAVETTLAGHGKLDLLREAPFTIVVSSSQIHFIPMIVTPINVRRYL
jgi:predicted ABC-type ATPase